MAIYKSKNAHSSIYASKLVRKIFGEIFANELKPSEPGTGIRLPVIKKMLGISIGSTLTKKSKIDDIIVSGHGDLMVNNSLGELSVYYGDTSKDEVIRKSEFMLYSKFVSTHLFGTYDDFKLVANNYDATQDQVDFNAYNQIVFNMFEANTNLHLLLQDANKFSFTMNYGSTTTFIRTCYYGCGYYSTSYFESKKSKEHLKKIATNFASKYISFTGILTNNFRLIKEVGDWSGDTHKRVIDNLQNGLVADMDKNLKLLSKVVVDIGKIVRKASSMADDTAKNLVRIHVSVDSLTALMNKSNLKTAGIVDQLSTKNITNVSASMVAEYKHNNSSMINSLILKYNEESIYLKNLWNDYDKMFKLDKDNNTIEYQSEYGNANVPLADAVKTVSTHISSFFVLGLGSSLALKKAKDVNRRFTD